MYSLMVEKAITCILLCSEVAGLAACFGLELCGEIVGRLEVEAVGYLLDAHVSSGEELLCTLQAQVRLLTLCPLV